MGEEPDQILTSQPPSGLADHRCPETTQGWDPGIWAGPGDTAGPSVNKGLQQGSGHHSQPDGPVLTSSISSPIPSLPGSAHPAGTRILQALAALDPCSDFTSSFIQSSVHSAATG